MLMSRRWTTRRAPTVGAWVLLLTAGGAAHAGGEWPQWGGPRRDFHAHGATLAERWPEGGPRQLWLRELGPGYSSICVDGDRLFTMYRSGDDEVVVALDASTGRTVWEQRYAAPFVEGRMGMEFGPGPHATPLVTDAHVYTAGVTNVLHCLDKSTGNVVWKHDLRAEYGSPVMHRGYSCSPLAYKGTIILDVGGSDGRGVMAFDQQDGRVVWQNQTLDLSHSSPILIEFAGKPQLVVLSTDRVVGLNPDDGELIWSQEHTTQFGANIATPVWDGTSVLICSSGYNPGGSRAVELYEEAGQVRARELWYSRRLKVHHGNLILEGDCVYGVHGDFGPAFLMALDKRSGEMKWRERGFRKSTCLCVGGGRFIMLDEEGDLLLARVTPEQYALESRVHLLERTAWTAPTLVGTTLYLRDGRTIRALDLSAGG